MVYPAVTPAELRQRQLEVTVWHHQSDGRHEFLGEFLLDLAGKQTQLVVSSPEKEADKSFSSSRDFYSFYD